MKFKEDGENLLDEDVRFEVLMIVSRLGYSVTWHHVVC